MKTRNKLPVSREIHQLFINLKDKNEEDIVLAISYSNLDNLMVLLVPEEVEKDEFMIPKVDKVLEYMAKNPNLFPFFANTIITFDLKTGGESYGIVNGEAICEEKQVDIRILFNAPPKLEEKEQSKIIQLH